MAGTGPAGSCAPDTVGGLLCTGQQHLRAGGIEAARVEARLLLGHVLGQPADRLVGQARLAVPREPARAFAALVARRVAGEPVQYLTGRTEFWSLEFEVGPGVLIPRADSETLIEAARDAARDPRQVRLILDLGTGSGCLLLAALTEFPAAFGVGVDCSPDALAIAARNAGRLGLSARSGFVRGDWCAPIGQAADLILCNPPYIPRATISSLAPDVALHEPRLALDGGLDGLAAYRLVMAALTVALAPQGVAIVELGYGQGAAVEPMAWAAGLTVLGTRRDLGGVPRALVLGGSAHRNSAEKAFGGAASAH